MKTNGRPRDLDLRTATGREINDAMARGVFDALRRHKEAGQPVVVWENGRIVHLSPEEIAVPEPSGNGDVTSPPSPDRQSP
jgi:hypothetical protein